MIVLKLEELFEHDAPGDVDQDNKSISPDNYKECNYLLRTASNIISILSHSGWITLLTQTIADLEKRPDSSKSEGESPRPAQMWARSLFFICRSRKLEKSSCYFLRGIIEDHQ